MTRIALMAAVTAVSAQMAVPLGPVPFTLQVLAVVLSGLLLGPRLGALAQAVYVCIGAVGLPVFSQFQGGLGVIVGPRGGYLLSYPLAAALAGLAAGAVANGPRRRALAFGFFWGCCALAAIYALGATWLAFVARLPFAVALAQGVLPFVLPDLVKVGLATMLAVAASPAIARSRT
jgi:biotin transport system substrate-specific component